jgi:hypothetical protein
MYDAGCRTAQSLIKKQRQEFYKKTSGHVLQIKIVEIFVGMKMREIAQLGTCS